ncbi:hypothetical protein [Longimycelium tulufanense]|uniref:hypothetical protein n=1 Tax=Longimycelium tulufanense TaxID=907463 RepID=UPI0016631AA6|nr:hypothetical protein [Longimycelium tulufanense]
MRDQLLRLALREMFGRLTALGFNIEEITRRAELILWRRAVPTHDPRLSDR